MLARALRILGCGRFLQEVDPLALAAAGADVPQLAPTPFDMQPASTMANPTRFVLKMIPVDHINEASEAQREARDLRYLRHPRIVRYLEDFLHTTPASTGSEQTLHVCIIMERCRTDLRRFIQKHRKQLPPQARRDGGGGGSASTAGSSSAKPPPLPIPEAFIIRVAAQLVSALRYCHSKGVVHRDVKSQNVFLTESDDIRLGDFGLARTFHTHPVTVHTDAGTDCYKSPEQFHSDRRDGRKGDIFALGIVLLEMATQEFAWEAPGLGAQLVPRVDGTPADTAPLDRALAALPACYTPSLRRLIRRCLIPDPAARPTAEELLGNKLLRRALVSKNAGASSSAASGSGAGGATAGASGAISSAFLLGVGAGGGGGGRTSRAASGVFGDASIFSRTASPLTLSSSLGLSDRPSVDATGGEVDLLQPISPVTGDSEGEDGSVRSVSSSTSGNENGSTAGGGGGSAGSGEEDSGSEPSGRVLLDHAKARAVAAGRGGARPVQARPPRPGKPAIVPSLGTSPVFGAITTYHVAGGSAQAFGGSASAASGGDGGASAFSRPIAHKKGTSAAATPRGGSSPRALSGGPGTVHALASGEQQQQWHTGGMGRDGGGSSPFPPGSPRWEQQLRRRDRRRQHPGALHGFDSD